MSLQNILDTLNADFGSAESAARRLAAENLIAAEERKRLLKEGDRAPVFALSDHTWGRSPPRSYYEGGRWL